MNKTEKKDEIAGCCDDESRFGIAEKDVEYFMDLCSHDINKQKNILIEECSELIKAISKDNRRHTKETQTDIIEEMTHVLISSAFLAKLLGISLADIDHQVEVKKLRYYC